MDEILLTDEEAEDIVHGEHDVCSRCEGEGRLWADGLAHYYDPNRPTKACPNCDGTGRVWSGREYEALCRAQVAKMLQWMKEHNSAPFDHTRRVTVGICDVLLVAKSMENLREAARRE